MHGEFKSKKKKKTAIKYLVPSLLVDRSVFFNIKSNTVTETKHKDKVLPRLTKNNGSLLET